MPGLNDEYGFDSVFKNDMEEEAEFDSMFDDEGDLIDMVSGLNESGESALDADEDEIHLNDTDAEPDDFEDMLGPDHDTNNAPDEAEGSEGADDNELALGEALGCNPSTEADKFYGKETEDDVFEGPKTDLEEDDLEGESDDMIDKALGESGTDEFENEENEGLPTDSFEENALDGEDDEDIDAEYEPGDADLVDMVIDGECGNL